MRIHFVALDSVRFFYPLNFLLTLATRKSNRALDFLPCITGIPKYITKSFMSGTLKGLMQYVNSMRVDVPTHEHL